MDPAAPALKGHILPIQDRNKDFDSVLSDYMSMLYIYMVTW